MRSIMVFHFPVVLAPVLKNPQKKFESRRAEPAWWHRRIRDCRASSPEGFWPADCAAETILLRDAIAGLHHRVGRVRARWRNRAEHNFLVADLESHYAPRNLRLIVVRQNLV